MRKVFCITCHKLTESLKLTVKYLSSFNGNTIIIHVDGKIELNSFAFLESDNVLFVTDRVSVNWGGFSQIDSTIKLLKQAKVLGFEYLFFISGDDLPCKSNVEIDGFLASIEYKNMIHFQDGRNSCVDPSLRVKYNYPSFFFNKEKSFLNVLCERAFKLFKFLFINKEYKKSLAKGVVYYKGTSWFSLNYKTVSLLLDFLDKNKWYIDIYNKSLCGDEVFFHTALKYLEVNDIYHDQFEVNDALRYIDWESGPQYPKVLNFDDVFLIKKTSCIFARKFNGEDKNDVVKCFSFFIGD